MRGRQCTSEQVPIVKDKFPTYSEFAKATIWDVYGDDLNKALHCEAKTFASSYLENLGGGSFNMKELPIQAQFSTTNGIIASDFNEDGKLDILLAGNLFVSEVETGRADAGTGLLLTGNGNGEFNVVPLAKSGFFADGDVKDIRLLNATSGRMIILVANNNSGMQVFGKAGQKLALTANALSMQGVIGR